MFWFKKGKKDLIIKEQILTIWSPCGHNTAKVSWAIANEIANHTGTALVELPCHGTPRLAVEAEIFDRMLHTDAAILEYERNNGSPMNFCHKPKENLAVLPANPYGLPDHPVVHKVTRPDTLQSFPGNFVNQARKSGYSVILFDCQGTLVSPMTFFALQLAKKIILVVDSPAEIAWALVNKERLMDTYEIAEQNFIATTINTAKQYHEEVAKVLKCPVVTLEEIPEVISEDLNNSSLPLAQKQVISQ